jgi:uncharacterized delta-60 repeat protein
MMSATSLLLRLAPALALAAAGAAHADGGIDPVWADNGRSIVGFLDSDTVQLRAFAKSPQAPPSQQLWLFGDDPRARDRLYIARLRHDGSPDPQFGPNLDGRRTLTLPADLIALPERLAVEGALVQADGKPLVFGGLRPLSGEVGAFPGLLCRLAVAGNLDASFAGGCVLIRSFLHVDETCLVTDVALTPDDKFVAVGNCSAPGFASRPFVTRINANGSIDFEFAAGAGLALPLVPDGDATDQHLGAVVVRPDGYIAVLGHVGRDTGSRRHYDAVLSQFDGGGSLDTEFGTNGRAWLPDAADADEYARDLLLRPDGRLLALAQRRPAHAWNEIAVLVQFATTGMPDPGFGSGGVRVDAFDEQLGPGSSLRSLALDVSGRVVLTGARGGTPSTAMAHAGTEFWLALWENIAPSADSELLVSADVATSGHLSIPGLGLTIPFTVTPGELTRVRIPQEASILVPDTVAGVGIRVSTQHPVTLHTIGGRNTASTGGARVTPSARLGSSYHLSGWGISQHTLGSAFIIAATEDATTLTITPTVSFGVREAGVPFDIVLQRGQAYYMASSSPDDLSGSTLIANHPVAVFGGHRCANVPFSGTGFCDLVIEQLMPDSALGHQFATLPMPDRNGGDMVRVMAIEGGTGVVVDGAPPVLLSAGEIYDLFRLVPTLVTTSKPATVAQFASGNTLDEPDAVIGDPLMLDILPREQWQARWTASVVRRPDEAEIAYWLTIIAPATAVGDIRVDGVAASPASFVVIGDGLVGAHVSVQPGTYRVSAPVPISVSVIGNGSLEAYGYPAGGSPSGVDADGDDLLVRYRPDGARDLSFGAAGLVYIDHRAGFGTALPSFDIARIGLVDGGELLVASASTNGASGQQLFVAYRLGAGSVFRDGFEPQVP